MRLSVAVPAVLLLASQLFGDSWAPDYKGGERLIHVTRLTNGGLNVFIEPKAIYQWATLTGQTFNKRYIVITRVYEVILGLAPENVAAHEGIKDPDSLWRYPMREWEANVMGPKSEPFARIVVTSKGRHAYLIRMFKFIPVPVTVQLNQHATATFTHHCGGI